VGISGAWAYAPTVNEFDPDDIGESLTDAELAVLIEAFRTSNTFPIVALNAATGAP
jgi:hypothetical protein